MRYVVSKRRLRNTCAVISLHSCGECGIERMQRAELRGQPLEGAQLPRHARRPRIAPAARRPRQWIRVDRLPDARGAIARILHQQPVQEGGAAARQAGDEDRPFDRLVQDPRVASLRVMELQQIGEEPHHVPARCHTPDQAERCLVVQEPGAAATDRRTTGRRNRLSPLRSGRARSGHRRPADGAG